MREKILLVDNDKDVLELLQFILEDKNYKVMTSDFEKIPSDAIKFKPDLILLGDWKPGTGLDICKAVKKHQDTCHIPVVLLSTSPYLAETAAECGAENFIHKPFDINNLQSVVSHTLLGQQLQ